MAELSVGAIKPLQPGVHPKSQDDPAKIRDAAQQFEALRIGQILRSVRESGGGWMGSESGSSGDSATEFAEQQFAAALSQSGGLGMADLIAKGLIKDS